MASQTTDVKTQDPGIAEPTTEANQNTVTDAPKPNSVPSVFVNSEPIREDQVENAVKFLSHPKVRGSPVIYRRSFLEKKGLTKEEIDEAFRRVPDPAPTVQAANVSQDAQTKLSNTQPLQAAAQAVQPAAAAPAGTVSSVKTISGYRFHWTHAIYAIGLMAVSGAGTAIVFKNSILPRMKSWIRKIVSEEDNHIAPKTSLKPSLTEEAAAAAKAAAEAAADVAKATQEMVNVKVEEKRYFEEFKYLLDVQLQEMRSMQSALMKFDGVGNTTNSLPLYSQDSGGPVTSSRGYASGKVDYHSGRSSSSPPPFAAPSTAHPKSYMEIMAMAQKGERPLNTKDYNDLLNNPRQQTSNSRVAARSKPWEVGQTQNNSNQYQPDPEGWNYNAQDSRPSDQLNSDDPVPWWQRQNPRITEVDNEHESKMGATSNGSSRAGEQVPVQQRSWVPPTPPLIYNAEAAEAIRRPKSSVQKDQPGDDQSAPQFTDATDELQRITRISETGGSATELIGASSEPTSTEIQEQQESY